MLRQTDRQTPNNQLCKGFKRLQQVPSNSQGLPGWCSSFISSITITREPISNVDPTQRMHCITLRCKNCQCCGKPHSCTSARTFRSKAWNLGSLATSACLILAQRLACVYSILYRMHPRSCLLPTLFGFVQACHHLMHISLRHHIGLVPAGLGLCPDLPRHVIHEFAEALCHVQLLVHWQLLDVLHCLGFEVLWILTASGSKASCQQPPVAMPARTLENVQTHRCLVLLEMSLPDEHRSLTTAAPHP